MAISARGDSGVCAEAQACFHFACLVALDSDDSERPHHSLLSWVLGLPAGVDPAGMAGKVLDDQRANPQFRLSASLVNLLEGVTRFPEERLRRLYGRRPRHVS